MGILGIDSWDDAAGAATVVGTALALVLAFLALRQYLRDSYLHRDLIAQEKLNEIYRLALAEPDLAEGGFQMACLYSSEPEDMRQARKYLWFYSAIIAHLEYIYLHFGHLPEWVASLRMTILPHRAFIESEYHQENGWWETYHEDFRKFVRELVAAESGAGLAAQGRAGA